MLRNWPKLLLLFTLVLTACKNPTTATSEPAATGEKPGSTPERPLPDVTALLQKLATQDAAKDATAEMRLQIEEADGKRAQLEFQLQRKYSADRVATLLKVTAPREESDKALLAIEKPDKPTEAFSYLAGLKRLARLNSTNTLSFREAKVTVQELLGMELNQYLFDAGERVTLDGTEMIKVTGKAKLDRNLAYAKINVYFLADNQQPARFELFNDRNELMKTTRIEEVKPVQNRQTLTKIAIEEHQTRRKLKLETRAIKYDQNLPDKVFSEDHLKSIVTNASQKLIQ